MNVMCCVGSVKMKIEISLADEGPLLEALDLIFRIRACFIEHFLLLGATCLNKLLLLLYYYYTISSTSTFLYFDL